MKGSTCLKYTLYSTKVALRYCSGQLYNTQCSDVSFYNFYYLAHTVCQSWARNIYIFRYLRVSTSWSFTQRVNVVFFYLFIVSSVFRFQRRHVRTHTQPPTSTGRPPSNPSFWRTTFTLLCGQLPPPPPSIQPRTQLLVVFQGEGTRGGQVRRPRWGVRGGQVGIPRGGGKGWATTYIVQ